jgi:DnaJ-class molecular chaperone
VRVKPHPHFHREGLDLHLDLPIGVKEAYQGAKVTVPTVGGDVTLKVPAHAQGGQVVRLKGKGVQRQQRSGDLYVRFVIRIPDSEDAKLKGAIDILGEATPSDLRDGIFF